MYSHTSPCVTQTGSWSALDKDEERDYGYVPPLKAYIDLYKAIQEVGNAEMDCEHPQHGEDPWGTHAGPGVWYMTGTCSGCGKSNHGASLVCDKFKEAVDMGKVLVQCKCGATTNAKNYLTTLGRR